MSHGIYIAALHLSGDVFYGCVPSAMISRGALQQMLLIRDHIVTRYLTPDLCRGDRMVHVMPKDVLYHLEWIRSIKIS